MSAPPLTKERSEAGEVRLPPRWRSRWRLVLMAAAVLAAAVGLILAWNWLLAGGVFVVFVIVAPCILAYALARLFTGAAGNKSASELDGT